MLSIDDVLPEQILVARALLPAVPAIMPAFAAWFTELRHLSPASSTERFGA